MPVEAPNRTDRTPFHVRRVTIAPVPGTRPFGVRTGGSSEHGIRRKAETGEFRGRGLDRFSVAQSARAWAGAGPARAARDGRSGLPGRARRESVLERGAARARLGGPLRHGRRSRGHDLRAAQGTRRRRAPPAVSRNGVAARVPLDRLGGGRAQRRGRRYGRCGSCGRCRLSWPRRIDSSRKRKRRRRRHGLFVRDGEPVAATAALALLASGAGVGSPESPSRPPRAHRRGARSVREGPLLSRPAFDQRMAAGSRTIRTRRRPRSEIACRARRPRGQLLRDVRLRGGLARGNAPARDEGREASSGARPGVRRRPGGARPGAVPFRLGFSRRAAAPRAGAGARPGLHAGVPDDGMAAVGAWAALPKPKPRRGGRCSSTR